MRAVFLLAWLALPFAALAYHYGPGQDRLALDDTSERLAEGRALADGGQYAEAAAAFEEALRLLPEGRAREARAIRLERARAQLQSGGLFDARADLATLLGELEADPAADPALTRDTRRALASAGYYGTWLLRLEGAPREEWEPEVEAARQHYRLLVDEAQDPSERRRAEADLAAAVRLSRMDLSELQGLPLPNQ